MERKSLDTEWFNYPGVKDNYRTMVYYPGNGSDTFEFNFVGGFINPADIKAFMIDDVNRDVVNLTVKVIGSNTAKLSQVVPVGWTVCIFRDTPKDRPLSVFQDGASITAKSLDRNAQQAIFAVSEMVDRFDSTVAQVETALKEVKKANDNATAALAESKKATGIAQGAVTKADTAVTTANKAESTANAAKERAEQAAQTAIDAKNTANSLDSQIKSANATAADAKRIAEAANSTANAIDGKATQAQKDAATAVNTANEAKQIAQSIDGKATQAQKDAAAALQKANDVEQSVGTVQELSKRVESFSSDSGVIWKGWHAFAGGQLSVSGSKPGQSVAVGVRPDRNAFVSYANSGGYHELTLAPAGLTYNDATVLTNKISSPRFTDSVVIEAPTTPSLTLRNTSNSTTLTLAADTNGLPYFAYSGATTRFTREGGTLATQEWTNTMVAHTTDIKSTALKTTGSHLYVEPSVLGWYRQGVDVLRVVPTGITFQGDGDYAGIVFKRSNGSRLTIQTLPSTEANAFTAYDSTKEGTHLNTWSFPREGHGRVLSTREWVNSQGFASQSWVNSQGFVKSAGTKLGPVVVGNTVRLDNTGSVITPEGFEGLLSQVPDNAVFCGVVFGKDNRYRTGAPKWRVIS